MLHKRFYRFGWLSCIFWVFLIIGVKGTEMLYSPELEIAPQSGKQTSVNIVNGQNAALKMPKINNGKDHQFWPSSIVYHFSFGEKIPNTIKDFCSMQDIHVVLSEKVEKIEEKANRVFRDMYPVDVWEQLTKTYGLLWFYDGSVLYVYLGTEIETKVLHIHPEQTDSLVQLVDQLGFYSSRLSLKAVREAGIVIASGPPKFMSLLEDMAKNMRFSKQTLPEDLCIRVFQLKHAWAIDKKVGELSIPGVTALLNNILGTPQQGQDVSTSSAPIDSRLSHKSEALKGILKQKEEALAAAATTANEKPQEEKPEEETKKDVLPRGGIIITDSRQNAIIVKDSKQNMHLYEEVIAKLDVPLELIEIKAAIVEVDNGIGLSMGTNSLTFQNKAGTRTIDINPIGTGEKASTTKDNWTINANLKGIVNGANFIAAIKYLEGNNSAKVLSRPSVITMDNLEAVMSRNVTYYESVTGNRTADLYPITSGTTLKVTPHVIRYGAGKPQIQLLLDIKDGTVTPKGGDSDTSSSSSNVNDSSIITQAVVFEGQSVLVGGYFKESNTHQESGIPFLKDIPILGNAFRSKVKNKNVAERLFLITPTIVRLSASDVDNYKDYFQAVESGHSVLDNAHVNYSTGRAP